MHILPMRSTRLPTPVLPLAPMFMCWYTRVSKFRLAIPPPSGQRHAFECPAAMAEPFDRWFLPAGCRTPISTCKATSCWRTSRSSRTFGCPVADACVATRTGRALHMGRRKSACRNATRQTHSKQVCVARRRALHLHGRALAATMDQSAQKLHARAMKS